MIVNLATTMSNVSCGWLRIAFLHGYPGQDLRWMQHAG